MSDEQQVDDTYSDEDAAMGAVKGPALALVIFAVIGLLFGLLGLLMNFGFMAGGVMDEYGGGDLMAQGALGIIQSVIGLGISVFIYMAAKKMERLENFGWAMGASIIAMVPCISPCCVLGIPVGIWTLIVLNKPEVKGAFQQS